MTSRVLSARWRRTSILSGDSERPTPTYYMWLIVTFALSRTVSELLVISDGLQTGNDVITFSPLGDLAPQFYLGILKGRPRLTICG